jgi:hypothetical protein
MTMPDIRLLSGFSLFSLHQLRKAEQTKFNRVTTRLFLRRDGSPSYYSNPESSDMPDWTDNSTRRARRKTRISRPPSPSLASQCAGIRVPVLNERLPLLRSPSFYSKLPGRAANSIWTLERGIDGRQIEIFARGCVFVKKLSPVGTLKCLSHDVGRQLTNEFLSQVQSLACGGQ